MFSIFLVFCVYQSLFSFPIGVAILSKKIIGLCRPSFLLFSSSSARPHKIDSKSDDAIETSLKAPLIQESLQSGNNSVHLKLIKDFGSGDNESKSGSIAEEITSQNETMSASILQYIINETGEVVVATLEEAGWEILDHFSIHKLGFNLSSTPGYSRREVFN